MTCEYALRKTGAILNNSHSSLGTGFLILTFSI